MNPAARIIKKDKEEIIDRWDRKVRSQIEASRKAQPLALRNFIPFLLDEIASIIDNGAGAEGEEKVSSELLVDLSRNHGRHRATSEKYSVEQVIQEYLALYEVIAEEFRARGNFSAEISRKLTLILGNSLSVSTGAFELSLQEMREKLIGVLAHDIRNPISAAYLALDVLDFDQGEERFHLVKSMAAKSLKRSLDLLEGLLDTVTIRAGQGIALNFYETDLLPQIRLEYEEAEQIYSRQLIFKCDENKIEGVFDATLVKRALGNLITNAIKYGDPEKPVTITAETTAENVLLSVHNLGDPIPPEKKKEIFSFLSHSGRDSAKGAQSWGMGLTLVQMVAQAHGGEIKLDSREEHGTTFTLVLKKFENKPGRRRASLNYPRD